MVTKKVVAQKPAAKRVVVKKAAPATAAKTVRATSAKSAAKPAVKVVTKPATKAPAVKAPALKKPAVKAVKVKKPKLVRDSFTMPQAEYDVLAQVKKACITAGIEIKKSELLRIGVAMLQKLDVKKIGEAKADLPALKAGRPSKNK